MRLLGEGLDFADVMMLPQISNDDKYLSRQDVEITRDFVFKNGARWTGIPIIASNMDTVASFKMSEAMDKYGMLCALHKFHDRDRLVSHLGQVKNAIMTIGISEEGYTLFKHAFSVVRKRPFWLCIDVANGYTKSFRDFIKRIRNETPKDELIIIAGNVVTKEMTQFLIEHGADIVKTGIGSGASCLTRKKTGVGYPQFSAIIDCADGAHGLGGMLVSDGGCTNEGDLGKAFGAGSDMVMLGSMLAGHTECLDPDLGINLETREELDWNDFYKFSVIDAEGKPRVITQPKIVKKHYLKFRGMSSKEVMDDRYGGMQSYRASEGKEVLIPLKGSVEDTLQEICGGLRSACTYLAARKLKEMPRRATFVIVRRQLNESLGKS